MTPDDPADFTLAEWPFYWVTRVAARYLDRLGHALKPIDLDVSRWRVLMCLGEDGAMGISAMADLAIVKLPTMMKIVQRMDADGLVTMAARASDGRVTEVTLTDRGRTARRDALAIARRIHDAVFDGIAPAEEAGLNATLRAVFAALGPEPPAAGSHRRRSALAPPVPPAAERRDDDADRDRDGDGRRAGMGRP